MDDTIYRQAAIDALTEYWHGICDRHQTLDGEMAIYVDCKAIIKRLPSAQQNRIARETAGKSPDEIYDFLYWLMLDYGMRFTDSRAAVIEWLKQEVDDETD